MRWLMIGGAVAIALGGLPLAASAQDTPVPEQIVNVMNKLWGSHAGLRANHTKGIVAEGSFTPTAEAAGLSTALLFKAGTTTPVTVRFSDATGVPDIPDGASNANPHGMAIKFQQADGAEVDIVANSLGFFPVATGEEFLDLLTAASESGPGAAKPTRLETFVASHPAVKAAGATVATPVSFATDIYNGINAFVFVDAAGKRQPFRFRLEPVGGAQHLSKEDAAKLGPNFLIDELPARVAKGPVAFRLQARLAAPGDPTADATRAWPDDRKLVDLGTLTLTAVPADGGARSASLLFLPGNLTDGIEVSDDPLIDTRNEAYAVSFGRRSE
jgi:catalase